MAKRERDRSDHRALFDLSDEEVASRWRDEIVPELRYRAAEATAVWECLGENYKKLGYRQAT